MDNSAQLERSDLEVLQGNVQELCVRLSEEREMVGRCAG